MFWPFYVETKRGGSEDVSKSEHVLNSISVLAHQRRNFRCFHKSKYCKRVSIYLFLLSVLLFLKCVVFLFRVYGTSLLWLIQTFKKKFWCVSAVNMSIKNFICAPPLCVNLRIISLHWILLHLPLPALTVCWCSLSWLGFCILDVK